MLSLMKSRMACLDDERGYTIIELLTVIVIMGILLVIATPAYFGIHARAQQNSAASAVRAVSQSIEGYYLDYGTFTGISAAGLKTSYDSSLHPYSLGTTYTDPVAVVPITVGGNPGSSYEACAKVKSWWAYKDGPADDIHYSSTKPTNCAIP